MLFAATTLLASVLIYLIAYICYAVGGYRLFAKFGEPGWKAFIPLYNIYVIFGKVWTNAAGLLVVILMLASAILGNTAAGNETLTTLASVINLVNLIVTFVGGCKLSKSFGHGIPFALGLTFLQPLFIIILGFNGDEYLGNTTEQ